MYRHRPKPHRPHPDGTFGWACTAPASGKMAAMTAPRLRLVALLLSCALATGLAATVVTASSLPSCKVADATTAQRSYSAWDRTVLDTRYRVTKGYAPGDLRSTANAGLNGGLRVRSLVIADLRAMASAARRAGARLAVQSAYRSYATQKSTFAYWSGSRATRRRCVRAPGPATASTSSARPSTSGATAARRRGTTRTGASRRPGLAQGECLEVRLHHVVPEGQVQRHVLRIRAVALPLCRPGRGGQGRGRAG